MSEILGLHRMNLVARFGFAILALGISAIQVAAQGRDLEIVNLTDFEIIAFYSAHKDAIGWGGDMLSGEALGSGTSRELSFEDGSGYCIYNIKAVFDDGEELVSEGVNVCDLPSFSYY